MRLTEWSFIFWAKSPLMMMESAVRCAQLLKKGGNIIFPLFGFARLGPIQAIQPASIIREGVILTTPEAHLIKRFRNKKPPSRHVRDLRQGGLANKIT